MHYIKYLLIGIVILFSGCISETFTGQTINASPIGLNENITLNITLNTFSSSAQAGTSIAHIMLPQNCTIHSMDFIPFFFVHPMTNNSAYDTPPAGYPSAFPGYKWVGWNSSTYNSLTVPFNATAKMVVSCNKSMSANITYAHEWTGNQAHFTPYAPPFTFLPIVFFNISSCAFNSGNRYVDCTEECTIYTNQHIGDNDFIFGGDGLIKVTSNISADNIGITDGCKVFVTDGGSMYTE